MILFRVLWPTVSTAFSWRRIVGTRWAYSPSKSVSLMGLLFQSFILDAEDIWVRRGHWFHLGPPVHETDEEIEAGVIKWLKNTQAVRMRTRLFPGSMLPSPSLSAHSLMVTGVLRWLRVFWFQLSHVLAVRPLTNHFNSEPIFSVCKVRIIRSTSWAYCKD